MPRYFTGRSVDSRTLKVADASTFADLVKRVMDMPVPLALTRDDFWALPKREQSEAKKVSYVVPCTFPENPWTGGRTLDKAGPCALVFLDIDSNRDGTSPATPFVDNPSILKELIGEFNFVAWKTISSTEESPRIRIMVEAADIPPEQYPDAVLTVAKALGLSHVTRESAIPVQPMFRPSVFADQDPDLEHPTLMVWLGGRAFKVTDICADLESLPGMTSAHRVNGHTPRVPADSVDDLAFYQSPVPGIDLEDIESALTVLDPDCGYFDWIEVAFAMRHQFPHNEEKAYQTFDTWSAKGSKYGGAKDTANKWKSCTVQPTGRAPITIRTVIKRACDAGWSKKDEMQEKCVRSVSDWIAFDVKDINSLMNEGVKRIAIAPLLTHTEEDALIQSLVKAAKDKFEYTLRASALHKDLEKYRVLMRNKAKTSGDAKADRPRPPWASGVVYVVQTDQLFRQATRQAYLPVVFDRAYSRNLCPTAEQLQEQNVEINEKTLNTPLFLPSQFVLTHLECPVVDDYDYDPGEPEKIVFERDRKWYVNTYRRPHCTANKAQAAEAEELLLDHLCNTISEPAYRRLMLDWMTYLVQHPGAKIRWALFLQGAEGCGKTIWAEIMRAVLGSDNARLINTSTLKRGWTEWAVGAQFIAIEEIRVAGANRHDLMNILKEPISNEHITINERNKATVTRKNVTNYMIFSNHHDALAVTEESRRYFVLKSRLQKKEQVQELRARDPHYFDKLVDLFQNKQGGLRHYFENRVISDAFDPNKEAPVTTYLHEMVHDTGSELSCLLKRVWEDADTPLVRPDIICTSALMGILSMESMPHVTPQYLASVLREAGFTKLEKRPLINGERQYVWARKDLLAGRNPLEVLYERVNNENELPENWM